MGNTDSSNALCIEMERDALLRFKKELEDPSNRLSSWVPEANCCEWIGIRCDNLTGHVKELNLANTLFVAGKTRAEKISFENSKLKGSISDSILNLTRVSHLDLSYNDFEGIRIPSFLGSLISLNYLNLTKSGFQGLIPHQLGNLSNLQHLDLRGNSQLYSENLQWIRGVPSLLSLDLSSTNLSKVSDWLLETNKLSSLVELRLSDCELNHITPLSHANFTSLSVLDISHNFFQTYLPKWISNLGHLVSLDLSWSTFEGPLPRVFSNLTSLQNFNLAYNSLNSSLPEWLFSLSSISSLDLNSNFFEGLIPCAIQNLSALTYLDLSICNFNSTIPRCLYSLQNLQHLALHNLYLQGEISNDIANLTSLVFVDLSRNKLEGSIPRSIGTLGNLRRISLSRNNFNGTLSNQIVKLRNLQVLDLEENIISGPIPEGIGNLTSLQSLFLGKNEFNGTLPKSVGSLSSLRRLSISHNRLEGIVSEVHFAKLVNLTILNMSKNNFTLSFTNGWIPPFNLSQIILKSCNLGPQFPKWLESQKNLSGIDLSDGGISDTVPSWFWRLSTTTKLLSLSHNKLSGKIPDFHIDSLSFEKRIYLGSNQFYGPLPLVSSNVIELDLSNNYFSGNMSHFLCHSGSLENQLNILHLGGNLLVGNIPDCWTKWISLRFVNLSNNNLFGKLPSSMGSLIQLQSLHLRNNNLTGENSQSLKNCLVLSSLDLGLNAFYGGIPTWIGTDLSSLMVLGLRSNNLSGLIPNELCHLSNLQIMDIGSNSLTGSIPHCFSNLTAMATKENWNAYMVYYSIFSNEFLENAYVTTKGRELQYGRILALMTSMDLSNNDLSGEIPQGITSLFELRSLNLSGNNLRGSIPRQIGSMTNMESLDLSRNRLSGQIPPSMSELTFLNHLNLSCNNLSGPIPTSTQLRGLNPSSFIGNKLCGPPLTNNCGVARTTPATKNEESNEGEESYIDMWFYLSLILGFAVGFWGIWGPLLISKTWRETYFRRLSSICDKLNQ